MKKLVFVTGGNGRFAKILKEKNKILNLKFFSKKILIFLILKMEKLVKKHKPRIILHCAGLSRPMKIHKQQYFKKYRFKYNWHS